MPFVPDTFKRNLLHELDHALAERRADLSEAPGTAVVVVSTVVPELSPFIDVLAPTAGSRVNGVSIHVPEPVDFHAKRVALELGGVGNGGLGLFDKVPGRLH